MSNDRDLVLQELFNEADEQFDGNAFTARVVKRTYGLLIRLVFVAVCLAVVVLAGMLLFDYSPLMVAQGISEVLTTPVFELGGGWAGWFLTPVNTIAGVFVLGYKGWRILHRKVLRGARFD